MWILALFACQSPSPDGPASAVESDVLQGVRLDPQARASRVSIALRGVRPTAEELARVEANPELLPALAEAWQADDRFGQTIRDLHADVLWMRADVRSQWPNDYDLAAFTQHEVTDAFQEAPLHLVEHIIRSGRPYTDVVRADYTLANEVVALMEGLPFDPDGPEWQVTHHVDGRPQMGLLSSTSLWQRWYTNFSGKNRNRANMVSRAFLCDEIGALDMPVFPSHSPTDNAATADALRNDPGCVACHVNLDPLAAYFWPYEVNLTPTGIRREEDAEEGCTDNPRCYPLSYWSARRADDYLDYDLPGPGYYGQAGTDFSDLGQFIADDPRFASCAVKNAWVFFSQRDVDALPQGLLDTLTDDFVASGYDYPSMVRELVLTDTFADASQEPMQLRPEAMQRLLEDLTGFEWMLDLPAYGTVPAMEQSRHGVRDLAGGQDHDHVLHNNYSPSPTVLLAWDAVTRQAAEHAVAEARVLDPQLTEPEAVREQIATLATVATGRMVQPEDVLASQLYVLFIDAWNTTGDVETAWRVTLRGLFMDPQTVTY